MNARRFVIAFGALILFIGLYVILQPNGLAQFAELFLSTAGLWIAVALRLTVGILLLLCASTSRVPRTLRVLGVLFILAAVALPFVGLDGLTGIVEWGSSLDPTVLRAVGFLAAAFGGFLIWSVLPAANDG